MRSSKPSAKRICIVAGEPSGDMHAAGLVTELKEHDLPLQIEAMGGDALKRTGAEILIDNRELAVVGLVEVLRHYPTIRRALKTLEKRLETHPPDLLVLVDYVEFNLRLARHAKQLGVPVLFYISPQVWAWRPKRVKKIGQRIDMMAVIFPFEVPFYTRYGIPVRYVGNPLVGKVKPSRPASELLVELDLTPDQPIIGLQPGSRLSELTRLAPLFTRTALAINKLRPDIQFVVPVAPGLSRQTVEDLTRAFPALRLIQTPNPYDVMQLCQVIVTASGTATLETALMRVPMLIAYQVAPLSYAIFRRLINIEHIGLANIVAGRRVVKEFIQSDATPDALANEALRLLDDKAYRAEILRGYDLIAQNLGQHHGSTAIAQLTLEMLQAEQN